MARVHVLGAALVLTLSACTGTAEAGPSASPSEAAYTSAQVASTVAKTRPQLEDAMDRFTGAHCRAFKSSSLTTDQFFICVDAMKDLAALSRVMQRDLEAVRPWSPETSTLAEDTVKRLGDMMEAANYGDGKSMAVTESAMDFLRSELQAWAPFGG